MTFVTVANATVENATVANATKQMPQAVFLLMNFRNCVIITLSDKSHSEFKKSMVKYNHKTKTEVTL